MPSSDRFLREITNTSSAIPVLDLIEVNIDGTLYYYVNNTESVTSTVSGSTQSYQQAAFRLELPPATEEGSPTAALMFDAGDITIIRRIRSANDRIYIKMWTVLADQPNVVEYGPTEYESTSFDISGSSVNITLEAEPILDVQIPGLRYTPNIFPGLWESENR